MTEAPRVVFVCEHGAAKSVLAATYFNHLAEQRGLTWRALARGTVPDAAIPRSVIDGLARDGLMPCSAAPSPLSLEDLEGAARVVSFDQPQLAALLPEKASTTRWDGLPPVSIDFESARAAILAKVRELVAGLERG